MSAVSVSVQSEMSLAAGAPAPHLPLFRLTRPCSMGGHSALSGLQPPLSAVVGSDAAGDIGLFSFDELVNALVATHDKMQDRMRALSEELRRTRPQGNPAGDPSNSNGLLEPTLKGQVDIVDTPPVEMTEESRQVQNSDEDPELCRTPPPEEREDKPRVGGNGNIRSSLITHSGKAPEICVPTAGEVVKDTKGGASDQLELVENTQFMRPKVCLHNFFTSKYCDTFIAAVVIFDGILLGIQAENVAVNGPEARPPLWIAILAALLKITFILELGARFFTYGIIKLLRSSGMMRLDTFVVACCTFELIYVDFLNIEGKTSINGLSIARFFRLVRLAKAARMSANFRTLWLLLSGLQASMVTMLWTIVLIVGISYGFAIVGMELIPPMTPSGNSEYREVALEKFGSLLRSMLTLVQILTLDDAGDVYRPLILANSSVPNLLYFGAFIMIVSITLMNLVTAVMVEGALDQANQDKEAQKEMEVQRQKRLMPRLREMFMLIDEDGSGEVSWEEIKQAPVEMQEELKNMTKADDLYEIFQLLDDDDSGSVMIDEFLDGILKASSGDVMLKLQIRRLMRQVSIVKGNIQDEVAPLMRQGSTVSSAREKQLLGSVER
eukprot:TRINITY_DN7111_c0_g3_i1.p1 TRINITY_DN7111_c0_g3~~TRINITY_DN7111_c0_g3_i1.p1  ORF type:complete len:610 (-),score=112.19 TRINITY_DN7111_c0_g3_i1:379-2208(-)